MLTGIRTPSDIRVGNVAAASLARNSPEIRISERECNSSDYLRAQMFLARTTASVACIPDQLLVTRPSARAKSDDSDAFFASSSGVCYSRPDARPRAYNRNLISTVGSGCRATGAAGN